MESAIAAIIIISIALFGILSTAQHYLSAQDAIISSWRGMEARMEQRNRTNLLPTRSVINGAGDRVDITVRNVGSTKLADFQQWDVFVQYYTGSSAYLIKRIPYTANISPGNDMWTVIGIYVDAAAVKPEMFEPGILNAGEEMVLRIKLAVPIGAGTSNSATIVTANGISASTVITR